MKGNVWIVRTRSDLKMITQQNVKRKYLNRRIKNDTQIDDYFSPSTLNLTLRCLNNDLSNSGDESGVAIHLMNDLIGIDSE
jgi:hypothetical protein